MLITETTGADTTTWAATIDGTEVAWLSVWTANREIANIDVVDARRGEGIARTLFEHADRQVGIYHTIAAHRTAEGDLFAEAVGGDTIAEDLALVVDCCVCDHCSA